MVGIRLARMGGVRSGENCVLMSRVRQIRFFLVLLPPTSEVCLVLLLYFAQVLLQLLLDFAWVLLLLFDFTCADKQLTRNVTLSSFSVLCCSESWSEPDSESASKRTSCRNADPTVKVVCAQRGTQAIKWSKCFVSVDLVGIRLARMAGVRCGENCVLMSRVRQIRCYLVLLPSTC